MFKKGWFTAAAVTLSAHYHNGCSLRRRPRPQQGPRRLHRQGRQHQLHDGVAAPRQQVRALPRVSQISGPSSPFFCFASARSPPETRAKAARISTIVALMFAELDLCTLCALFGLPRRWGAHLDPRRQRSDAAPDREIIRQLSLEKGFILRDHRLPRHRSVIQPPGSCHAPICG